MGDAFVQVRYHVAIEVVTVFPGPLRRIHILKLCAVISGIFHPGQLIPRIVIAQIIHAASGQGLDVTFQVVGEVVYTFVAHAIVAGCGQVIE